eukprot:s362_g19.t1
MSQSKPSSNSSKPLSLEEQQLLMQLQRRASIPQDVISELESDGTWSLASECVPCAMSDASKRRLTEFTGDMEAAPWGYGAASVIPPVCRSPEPPIAGGDQATMLGSTKKGTQIEFPPGVSDLGTWGCTILDFGKYGGKEITYDDLVGSSNKDHKSYVKWCISQVDASEGKLRDFSMYLVARENVTGTMEQRPVIPGTTEVRRLRRDNSGVAPSGRRSESSRRAEAEHQSDIIDPGSLLLRSTLSSKRPLDVSKLQSSFQSRIFQQDLFEAINASEAASAVRGPVQVRAVSVAPIMHSGTVKPSKTLWKMMGLSGWRLSEVLLFLLFVLTLCCLIPLLARFLTQCLGGGIDNVAIKKNHHGGDFLRSWSRSAGSVAPMGAFSATQGGVGVGVAGDARFLRGPMDHGDAWSNASTYSDRNLVDPWAGGFSNYEVDRRRGGDLGFSALGPPPRPRSYDEEGSLAEAMLSPTPSYPSRGRSGSSAPSPSRSFRQVPAPLLSDISLGSASSSRPGTLGPPPVPLSSGEGGSSGSHRAGIPAVVRARPLARSWLEDQGRQVDVVPARYLDPGLRSEGAEVQYPRDSRVRQMEIDPRSGRPWSGH